MTRGELGLGWLGRGTHNMGLRPDTIQSLKKLKTCDAAHFHGHTEWSTRLLELGLEPKEVSRCQLSNPSKITSFERRMRERSSKPCRSVGWIRDERNDRVGDDLCNIQILKVIAQLGLLQNLFENQTVNTNEDWWSYIWEILSSPQGKHIKFDWSCASTSKFSLDLELKLSK